MELLLLLLFDLSKPVDTKIYLDNPIPIEMAGYKLGDDGLYTIPLIDLGVRLRDNFGLTIREHPYFDPVDGKHADNSYHYIPGGGAIDIQDWRADSIDGVGYVERTKNLRDLLRGAGPEVIGPGDMKGHESHLHLAGFDGGKNVRLTPTQYSYLFGGNAGGKNSLFSGVTAVAPAEPSTGTPNPGTKTELSPAEVNAKYDEMRMAGDVFKAQQFGMREHKRLFNK